MGSVKEDLGVAVKKEEDFSTWYHQVILRSGLADYSPVKGCMVIKPWGYAIWEKIQEYLNKKFKELGIKNAYFPLFIPKSTLSKESEHVEGFVPEVAWVTKGGDKDLDEPLAIRPTSETIMYEMFSKWIRSHRDLPFMINQWANIVRWETKSTRLFLRTREFLWQEGHTVHKTKEEGDKMVLRMLDLYEEMCRELLAIATIKGYKTENEKFAGALYTTTIESLMPDMKALQMGTSHHLGQNFSKAYEIKFLDESGKERYAWQTSWGVSTRLIGALVMVHGDNNGLVLPPRIAPLQVVVIPIWFQDSKEIVLKYLEKVENIIKALGVEYEIDLRDDVTPGFKFNEWDLKGVPIRVEVGPRDAQNNTVVIYRRDLQKKTQISLDLLGKQIPSLMEEIQKNLYERSKRFLEEHIIEVETYEEFKDVIENKKGIAYAYWCGNPECEEKIKEETKATSRCIPFESYNKNYKNRRCVYCGKPAKHRVLFARAY